jgi:putative DNA primase/helicase
MTRNGLPPYLAAKHLSYIDQALAAPEQDRLEVFRARASDYAHLSDGVLSRAEIADRLQDIAVATGIVPKWSQDDVQEIIKSAIESKRDDGDAYVFDDGGRPPEFSDEALALQFAERRKDSLRYVAVWKRWLLWDVVRWASDDKQWAYYQARRLCREIASKCDQPRIATAIASKNTIKAVLSLASADPRIAATVDQWDCDPWLLNTPSGVVDLRSGKLRPHDPNDYHTKCTSVGPDAAFPSPRWQAFLNCVCRGDPEFISFIRRTLGYILTGVTREHALFFCYGTGANGKSTFINAIAGCIGDYHRVASIETFIASNSDRHPTDLAALRGARLVTAVETEEGRRWAESKIKSVTGGDKISARFMRQDFFEFDPTFKLVIAGNHKPGLRSVDEAIRRRFHLLPFVAAIPAGERDEQLGEKLKAEWPAILAWMISGCLDWQHQGLEPPAAVRTATAEYLEAEDSFAAWFEQSCDLDPDAFERTTNLFESWKKSAQSSGEYVGTLRKFSQRLEERGEAFGLRKGRDGHGNRGFYGLRLGPTVPTDASDADDVVPI